MREEYQARQTQMPTVVMLPHGRMNVGALAPALQQSVDTIQGALNDIGHPLGTPIPFEVLFARIVHPRNHIHHPTTAKVFPLR